jgi:HSP20 family protein
MSGVQFQRSWDPFRELHREVGRLIGSLDPFQSARRLQPYPPLNIYDTGDRFLMSVQLPGMTPADIELTITGETLTIRGERKKSEGVKEDSYRRQERPVGRWVRTVTLPDRVESAQVAASFSDGILTISIPKAEDARPRWIVVAGTGPVEVTKK